MRGQCAQRLFTWVQRTRGWGVQSSRDSARQRKRLGGLCASGLKPKRTSIWQVHWLPSSMGISTTQRVSNRQTAGLQPWNSHSVGLERGLEISFLLGALQLLLLLLLHRK